MDFIPYALGVIIAQDTALRSRHLESKEKTSAYLYVHTQTRNKRTHAIDREVYTHAEG